LEKDFPLLALPLFELPPFDPPPLLPPPLEAPLPEPPLLAAVLSATGICNDFWLEFPFASSADTTKLKVPALLGVPDTVPESFAKATPLGNCPDDTANVYGAVPPVTESDPL
jgi:hypothetical protein